MTIYYFLLVLLVLIAFLSYHTDEKVLKINRKKIYLNTVLLYLIIGILYLVSSFRYGIGNDYLHYQSIYASGSYATYEWFFLLLCRISSSIGLTFQGFIFVLNLFVYIPMALLIDKCVDGKYKLYSILIYYIYNFYGASFNYIRQFPAIIICFAFSYFLSLGYKNMSRKIYIFAIALLMGAVAVGFHKTILIAFLFALASKFNVINRKNVLAISIIFVVLYFINPYDLVINWINNYIIANVSSVSDIAWNNRLLNTGASFINRILFFPIIGISTFILRGKDTSEVKNEYNPFNRVAVSITYLYYLLISMDIGSEMLDRTLLPLYIYNVFSFPVFLNACKKMKYGKWVHCFLYILIVAIGIFILLRQLNANIYQIVPYQMI